jgi:hypothetical protein
MNIYKLTNLFGISKRQFGTAAVRSVSVLQIPF